VSLNPASWAYGALALVGLCAGFWIAGDWHGHKAGRAAGDAEVARLTAQYAVASQKAAEAARIAQERADALTAAQVQSMAKDAQKRAQEAAGVAADANARLLAAQRKLDEVSRHDHTVADWQRTAIPAGVLRVLDRAAH
jgi:hypothetical protein